MMDYEAIKAVGARLRALPKEELRKKIEECRNGEIAHLLLEGGFFAARAETYIPENYGVVHYSSEYNITTGVLTTSMVTCQVPCSDKHDTSDYDFALAA